MTIRMATTAVIMMFLLLMISFNYRISDWGCSERLSPENYRENTKFSLEKIASLARLVE